MLTAIITFLVGLLGAVGVSYGAWLVYEPAGYIVAGLMLIIWSFMAARASSHARYQAKRSEAGGSK